MADLKVNGSMKKNYARSCSHIEKDFTCLSLQWHQGSRNKSLLKKKIPVIQWRFPEHGNMGLCMTSVHTHESIRWESSSDFANHLWGAARISIQCSPSLFIPLSFLSCPHLHIRGVCICIERDTQIKMHSHTPPPSVAFRDCSVFRLSVSEQL